LSGLSVPKWMSGKAAKTIGAALIGGTLGTAFAGKTEEEVTELARDKDALKAYLRQYYTNVNPELSAHPEQVDTWVESQVKEYYADGGRIGYDNGGDVKTVSDPGMGEGPFMMEEFLQAVKDGFKGSYDEYIDQIDRSPADYLAQGGRIGYAHGSNDKVMMASGIEGIPINQNQAGINELDMRDRGGFIPPVGVKEKADDIPAMVSNNEFVMTADAVKGMGGGDVNRGAQKMYQLMETLENGGRV